MDSEKHGPLDSTAASAETIARWINQFEGELDVSELGARYLEQLRIIVPDLRYGWVWPLPPLDGCPSPVAIFPAADRRSPSGEDDELGQQVAELLASEPEMAFIIWQPDDDHNQRAAADASGLATFRYVHAIRSRGEPIASLLFVLGEPLTVLRRVDLEMLSAIFAPALHVSGLTIEANRARTALDELERLNKAKSDFVSIVSHEFRTPLTGIQGFSEMMVEEDLTYEEMKEFAGDINKDAKRLNRLITEMLDLDRMESGRMTLNLEPVDLNAVIRGVVSLVQPNAPSHQIVVDLAPSLPELTADHDKLTQVMTNLLNNAVKYCPNGGEIEIESRAADGTALISVHDHGTGIPANAIESVFERYTRIESTARYVQGTGLGLPIVRQIVHMHGGRVWVESELGRGSTFFVSIPLVGAAEVRS